MNKIGSKKVEQCAIDKINNLIGQISCADSHISKNDKSISWDGTIDFYKGNIDKKENYEFSIDVQVKGRTTYNKKLSDKYTFDFSIIDIKNFLKKDGTLFLLVLFKKDLSTYKIYYIEFLPYNITRELNSIKESSVKSIRQKMKELKDSDQLETICRNFQINKEIQKRMNKNAFIKDYEKIDSNIASKFSIWEKDLSLFKPENLVGTFQYFYDVNENGNPIGVKYGMIYNMSKKLDVTVSTIDKAITFDDLLYVKSADRTIYIFGNSFTIDTTHRQFNIKICGTLNDRIKKLKFTNLVIEEQKFLIGEDIFKLNNNIKENQHFIELEKIYIDLRNILNKHGITKDLNLDLWSNKEIDELFNWLNAIENKKEISIESNMSLLGSKTINELKLSIIAKKLDNGLFKVESIWKSGKSDCYSFIITNGEKEIKTKNIFLILNTEAYLSDDIDYNEMKLSFPNNLTLDECLLMNFQVLDILKAYDISNNIQLLNYAEYLVSLLLKNDIENKNIYYINYCQILKRKNMLTDKENEELIKIRDQSNEDEIKLCCNALIDNKTEKDIILKRLDKSTREILNSYPISIYF